jgi:hypothetical protein
MISASLLALALSVSFPSSIDREANLDVSNVMRYSTSCVRDPLENAGKFCSQEELRAWRAEISDQIGNLNTQVVDLAKKTPFKGCSFNKYENGNTDILTWSSSGSQPILNSVTCKEYIRRGLWDTWNQAPSTARNPARFSDEFITLFESWKSSSDMTKRDEIFWGAVDKALAYAVELHSVAWPKILEVKELNRTIMGIDSAIEVRKKIDASESIPHTTTDCPLYRNGLVESYVPSGKLVTFTGGAQSLCKNGRWIDKGKVRLQAKYLTCSLFNSKNDYGCWVKDSRGFLTWLFDLPQGTPKGKVVSRGSYYTNNGFCQVSLYSNFAYRIKCN